MLFTSGLKLRDAVKESVESSDSLIKGDSLIKSDCLKDGGYIQLTVVCCLRLLYVILVQICYPKIVNVKL